MGAMRKVAQSAPEFSAYLRLSSALKKRAIL